ncbi:MAG: glycoside hydrolase family 43 protein, partial [Myxococcota bacterium]|nr:glycoside hydrolase family 43 protein [Myxococcota bacterium]
MALKVGRPRAARVLVFVVLCVLLVVAAPAARASGYVFSTFHNDTAAGEKLSTFRSADALQFTLVADTGFAGPSGYLRDPSIMKHVDGKYYVAYTDPLGPQCCGKVDHFSIASSADLVHWTNLTAVMAGVAGVAHAWAPEWFVDGSTVYVIANIDTLNNDTDFKPYVFTALDSTLSAWSGPVPLGFGPNYIDTFVLKARGVYHAFTKNETTRYLEHATAPSLTGPWTFVGTGNWSGFGPGMEGPCVVALDDGTWRIFVDSQSRPITARFLTATSPDLTTWSAPIVLPGWGSLRHGTVIRDTPGGSVVTSDGGTIAEGGSDTAAGNGAGDD